MMIKTTYRIEASVYLYDVAVVEVDVDTGD